MKKILYVTNITRNVNAFFIPHINMLFDNGYCVDCACKISGEHEIKKDQFRGNIKFFDIPFMRTPIHFKNFIALYKLFKIQKKENYDVIHVHSPIAGIYTRLLKIFFPSVKMVYTAHGFHFYKGSSKSSWIIFGNLERIFSKLTNILVTINEEDYEVAKTFYCKDVRKINGVGVDPEEFKEISEKEIINKRAKLGIKKEDRVFIMVGEHNRNKNQMMLLKCINEINQQVDNAKFIFIGDGEDLEKNKNYAKENNLKNTYILGFRKDVNQLINISDVVVSLSYREGLPKNLLEGMIKSKCLVGTNIRGNNELIEENKNGNKVDINSLGKLEKIIVGFCNMENKKLNVMKVKSKDIFKKYDIKIVLQELKNLY